MVLADLVEIKETELAARKKVVMTCCLAAGCMSSEGKLVKEALDQSVKAAGLEADVEVRGVGCMKLCCEGPLVLIDPPGVLYQKVKPADAASLVGTLSGGTTAVERGDLASPFFAKQMSVVLENSGAQRGVFILKDGEEWVVEAEGDLARGALRMTRPGARLAQVADRLPGSVVSYVIRTEQAVTLNDTGLPGLFRLGVMPAMIWADRAFYPIITDLFIYNPPFITRQGLVSWL